MRFPPRWHPGPILTLCGTLLLVALVSTPASAATAATTTAQGSTGALNNNQADLAAILALTFGLLAIVGVLIFLFRDRTLVLQSVTGRWSKGLHIDRRPGGIRGSILNGTYGIRHDSDQWVRHAAARHSYYLSREAGHREGHASVGYPR